MKTSLLAFGLFVALVLPVSFAQEARVERFTKSIYGLAFNGTLYFNEVFFVNQENAPVAILDATARHIPREAARIAKILYRFVESLPDPYVSIGNDRLYVGDLTDEQLMITIDARGENVKFGVIVYDAFKEHLGGLTAITMDAPTVGMQWDYRPP